MAYFKQSIYCPFPFSTPLLPAWKKIQENLDRKAYPFFEVLYDHKGLEEILAIASQWNQRFDHIVVLGTGGSSLGGKTLVALKKNPFSQGKVIFMDNVDPKTFADLFDIIDPRQTGFCVISKSGSTAETLCQFLCILKLYEDKRLFQKALSDHFLVITEPKESILRQLGSTLGCMILDHSPHIGGRFSVFSNVGLLPAAIAGIDVRKVRQGAQKYLSSSLATATEGAFFQLTCLQKGYDISVMMPYVDRLQPFANWHSQLWAESLGKEGKGTTPVSALGTVDQHSQLQLYRDGPRDKLFTFIYRKQIEVDFPVSARSESFPDLLYLQQKKMSELLEAELHATSQSLMKQGCPTRLIELWHLNEESLGSLLTHFMLETILMAELLEVNAFDQPGVEESKILTRHFLEERKIS
jgi:glucose-6-phosphate isomerase